MKKIYLLMLAGFVSMCNLYAQNTFPATGSAGIGTAAPNASALLEMVSTSKGLLTPRMTKTQRDAIALPATGLLVYQTNSTPGFYYYSGTAWTAMTPKSKDWSLTGNAGTSPATNFIGTTDAQPLIFKVNNQLSASLDYSSAANTSFGYKTLVSNTAGNNSAFGYQSLFSNTTGGYNTAVGTYSLLNNTLGYQNTAIGSNSLQSNQIGNYNAALGYGALLNNTTGSSNIAIGNTAMLQNVSGSGNIAIGDVALYNSTTTNENIAIGNYSLYANTTGISNTATGHYSLQQNTTGNDNTANGISALFGNTTGNKNSAFGSGALSSNTTGNVNTANGKNALYYNTTGSYNTAIGVYSLEQNNADENTAVGVYALQANTTGNQNTAVGAYALTQNTSGYINTATGKYALAFNISGFANTANGYYALYSNDYGYGNTATGYKALLSNNGTAYYNTATGYRSLTNNTTGVFNTAMGNSSLVGNITGTFNTAIGNFADVLFDNLINATAIGANALVDASYKVRIGSTGVTSIGGQVGWTTFSDGRYKKNIKQNVQGLAFINSLQPITYTVDINGLNEYYDKGRKQDSGYEKIKASMKESSDKAAKIVYNGFVAQDVEKAAEKLNYNFSGVDKPQSKDGLYGLRYADFVVPLVKAVQELSKENEEQKKINTDLQNQIDELKLLMQSGNQQSMNINQSGAVLEQNIPNPFNQSATINYTLPAKFSSAKIIVTDNNSKTIKQFTLSSSGKGSVSIAAGSLASGLYHYALFVDDKMVDSKKMEIIR